MTLKPMSMTSYKYIVIVTRNDGNVLFNDAFNTFIYRVEHMIKDHSDSETKPNVVTTMATLFKLAARDILYTSSHRQDSTY